MRRWASGSGFSDMTIPDRNGAVHHDSPASAQRAPHQPAPALSQPVQTAPAIRLERKHPLAIRWMHWINFPVLFTMIWSGILIYWNDSDNTYQHPHQVYRLGLGRLTVFRFFPGWFYKTLHIPYHVTQGLSLHFFFMWVFAINGVAWVLYTWLSGEWHFIVPQRRSLGDAVQVTLVTSICANNSRPKRNTMAGNGSVIRPAR